MELRSETVGKVEAARRQLREAILLFFEGRDLIAVHTLAAASLQVFADVGATAGASSLLKDARFIREDKKKLWFDSLHEAQNFFKHADRDPSASLNFKPSTTPYYILDSVLLEAQLQKSLSPASNCFLLWFYLAHPDVLTDEPYQTFSKATNATGIEAKDFEFFRELILRIEQQRGA